MKSVDFTVEILAKSEDCHHESVGFHGFNEIWGFTMDKSEDLRRKSWKILNRWNRKK